MTASPSCPFLVVGLGNPGPAYEMTRHNIGFLTIDELADGASPCPASLTVHKKSGALSASMRIGDRPVILAKPQSFMNLSGKPVAALCSFFSIPPSNVIVVHDELDLEFGTVRIKQGGGDNGHNGLKSITSSLKTNDYVRIRVGIGRPPGRMAPADWVLKPFRVDDQAAVSVACADAADAVQLVVTQGVQAAQNDIHAR